MFPSELNQKNSLPGNVDLGFVLLIVVVFCFVFLCGKKVCEKMVYKSHDCLSATAWLVLMQFTFQRVT